jgi:N,N'-diacetyllegionaminate synthase
VLHCTSAYPTSDDDVNLSALRTISDAFGVPVGYSDHTPDIFVAPLAVAMGAIVIEKHMTLDRDLPGPDHRASLLPEDMRAMIVNLRRSERLLGDGVKSPRPIEAEARQLARRGLKAARPLVLGHILAFEDIAVLRPADGIPPSHIDDIIGRRMAKSLAAGEPIEWTSLR